MEDITTIPMPPRTMMEVFKSLPEGTMVQLIENNIIMSPAPLDRHQRLLARLTAKLYNFCLENNLGEVRGAPYDVYLDRKNALQPDLCFIATQNLHLIKENGLHGAPDLVVEILSPGTARYDLFDKKDVYERCGVKELWLIDPADKSATGYWLTGDEYQEFFKAVGSISFRMFDLKFDF